MKSLVVKSSKSEVIITERYWDGIDKPDYSAIDCMSPAASRLLAQDLIAAAYKAECYKTEAQKDELAKLRGQQREIDARIRVLTR